MSAGAGTSGRRGRRTVRHEADVARERWRPPSHRWGLQKGSSGCGTWQRTPHGHHADPPPPRELVAPHAPALSYWGRVAQWPRGSQFEHEPGDHPHCDRRCRVRPGRLRRRHVRAALGSTGHLAAPGLPRHPPRPRSARGRIQRGNVSGLPRAGHRRRGPGRGRVELGRHTTPTLARHPHPGRRALRRERHRDLPQRPGQRPHGQPPRRRAGRPGRDGRPGGRLARGISRAHPRSLRPAPAHAAGTRPPDRRRAPAARRHRAH